MDALRYGFLWPIFGLCGLAWLVKHGIFWHAVGLAIVAFLLAVAWACYSEVKKWNEGPGAEIKRKEERSTSSDVISRLSPPQ